MGLMKEIWMEEQEALSFNPFEIHWIEQENELYEK